MRFAADESCDPGAQALRERAQVGRAQVAGVCAAQVAGVCESRARAVLVVPERDEGEEGPEHAEDAAHVAGVDVYRAHVDRLAAEAFQSLEADVEVGDVVDLHRAAHRTARLQLAPPLERLLRQDLDQVVPAGTRHRMKAHASRVGKKTRASSNPEKKTRERARARSKKESAREVRHRTTPDRRSWPRSTTSHTSSASRRARLRPTHRYRFACFVT